MCIKAVRCLKGKSREMRPGWQASGYCPISTPKRTGSRHVLCHDKKSWTLWVLSAERLEQMLWVMLSQLAYHISARLCCILVLLIFFFSGLPSGLTGSGLLTCLPSPIQDSPLLVTWKGAPKAICGTAMERSCRCIGGTAIGRCRQAATSTQARASTC